MVARPEDLRQQQQQPPERPTSKLGPEDAESVPFVDFNPAPGDPDPDWHPLAQSLYNSMKTDPARIWMGTAGWATTRVMCEALSRELGEQVVAWNSATETHRGSASLGDDGIDYVPDTKQTTQEPVLGHKTLSSGTLTVLLKWMQVVGINEGDRLRLEKEITFGTALPSIAEAKISNLTSIRSEALRG